jgi:16S rRNA G966 N2-methylase RsmD
MHKLLGRRLESLLEIHRHADYVTDIFQPFGLPLLFVGEKVLRPDKSYVSKYLTLWLANSPAIYRGKRVLEIGCGSGVQSVTMAMRGACHVVSTDISAWAMRSCVQNVRRLGLQKRFSLRQGDLFQPIQRGETFDVVLFNHPFFRGRPDEADPFESALLDNRELAGVFLDKVWNFLTPGGSVIMPYSSICGSAGDPRRYAEQLSLSYKPLFEFDDSDGKHWLFQFRKRIDWLGMLPRIRPDLTLQALARDRWRLATTDRCIRSAV